MAVSPRLLSLSRLMAWLSLAGFVLVPAITTYVFLYPDTSRWLMFNIDHLGATLNGKVPLNFRLMALLCEGVSVGFTMWALWSLRRLFLTSFGDVLHRQGGRDLRNNFPALVAALHRRGQKRHRARLDLL